ncbi:signal peptidase I [Streptomyces sp. NPDC055157]
MLAVLGIVLAAGALGTVRSDYTTVILSGGSMEPTYAPGDRIVIAKTSGAKTSGAKTSGAKVRRGDVVLFGLPDRFEGKPVLKRVIGLGGDHVVFDGTRLTVNDAPLKEPYLKDGEVDGGHGPYDVKVPAGRMFLLGDHRANSNDSRYFAGEDFGTVPVTAVRGRVLDDDTAPVMLGLGVLLGVVLALAGAVCTLVGWLTRRRRPAAPALFAQPLA